MKVPSKADKKQVVQVAPSMLVSAAQIRARGLLLRILQLSAKPTG
jgi:hypothetical protein